MPLTLTDTPIRGVLVVHRTLITDDRGTFERLFDMTSLKGQLGTSMVNQVNYVRTVSRGTVRGLHIQLPPDPETKLIACTRGAVFDVAVDLRPNSPTFGDWFGQELSETNHAALLIPEGCAHGIQTLQDDCGIVYVHKGDYMPGSESGLSPLDPEVSVSWPLPVANLSARDASCATTLNEFLDVTW